MPKHQLQKFIGCLKMFTNNEPKERTYYTITSLRYLHGDLYIRVDSHFSVFKAECPRYPDGMEYMVKFLTNINTENFYKDLEEIVCTMEPENENSSKQTILKP